MSPRSDLPEWAKDAIYNNCDITFSFWDRVKILFGWKVTVRAWTYCEVRPARIEGHSDVSVWCIWPWQRFGVVEAKGEAESVKETE